MPDTKKNALAELANELSWIETILGDEGYGPYCADANKASRIIAELAKVPDCTFKGNPRVDKSADAVIACRAIAEEGEDNGNG